MLTQPAVGKGQTQGIGLGIGLGIDHEPGQVHIVTAPMQGDRGGLLKWLGLTILIGTTFVSIQAYEYTELVHNGSTPNVDLFWSTFYAMTGFHGLHVTAGVIWLAIVWLATLFGKITKQNYMKVELAGLYWHFVDLVWIFLFPFLYLIGLAH